VIIIGSDFSIKNSGNVILKIISNVKGKISLAIATGFGACWSNNP